MIHSARYIGAIDQGTSSTRFSVFNRQGACVSIARREHRQICQRPGWVEHDASEIWRNTLAVIAEALAQAGLTARDLAAVGIANQRETTLVWDGRTGAPLHHAIVWQDVRVADRVAAYAREGGADRFRAVTGLPLASYFSALKLQWLLELPLVRSKMQDGNVLFGTMDTWLLWNLSGGCNDGLHLTDVSNASRTQLMNLMALDWDSELLRAFEVPECVLPQIVPSSCVYGEATIEPLCGVPIGSLIGDQQAALFGQACFDQGDTKNTYGTGCFLLMNTGQTPVLSTKGLITTVAYQAKGERPCYALEGSIAVAGALVQWLRDELRMISSSEEVERLAQDVPDNGGVYFVPAFSGLYAPYWNGGARGLIAGLTRFATRSHVARAALEATAYQTRDVIAAMELDAGVALDELRVDGGMVENSTLMQFQADLLDVPVLRPPVKEMTALGAAYAAGLAVGYWQTREELKHNYQVEQRWTPTIQPQTRAKLLASWEKAVMRSLDWVE